MKYLLVLLALAFVVYQAWRKLWRTWQGLRSGAALPGPQVMVRCAYCGLHVPQHEAFYRAGQSYCSVAHAHGSDEAKQPESVVNETARP